MEMISILKVFYHMISQVLINVAVFNKHKFLASSLLLLFSITCFCQNCLPEGIQFKSQSQVDSFRILYPGCTMIGGNVKFSVGGHFTSFDSLDHIQIIEGNLELRGAITSLDTIRAFRSLKAVNGDLFLSYLFNVEAIIGFDSILHIGGHLALTDFHELNILDAFENLESIGENLEINFLNIPGSIHFFPRLRYTGGRINIEAGEINTITGFDSLIYIGDDLRFWEVTGLTTIDAFANLERIDGGLHIVRILDAGHFHGFPKLKIVKGDVAVLSFLDSLSGFGLLDTIGGSFELLQNDSLREMHAFQNVRYVGDNVRIESNPLLKSFSGLNLLDSIYNDLIVSENASLDTLATFEKLAWIGDVCHIQQNQNLRSLNFLHTLASADDIVIQNNASLLSLSGLENIEKIGNDVRVENNSGLLSITGLQNLRRIPRDINIEGNQRLHDLGGLEGLRYVGRFMEIIQNDSLVTLEGIDHLDSVKAILLIKKNPSLGECAIESVCLHFIHSTDQIIESNAVGCNSVMEVEAQCLTASEEIPFESIGIHPNPVEQELFLSDDTFIDGHTTYFMYDCLGRLIKVDEWHGSLQLGGLPSGIYTLLIKKDHEIRQGRVIKK